MLSLVLKGERPTTRKPRGVHPGAWQSAQPSIRRDGLRRRRDGSKLHAARIAQRESHRNRYRRLVSARVGGGGRPRGGAAQLLARDRMRDLEIPCDRASPEPDHPGSGARHGYEMRDGVAQHPILAWRIVGFPLARWATCPSPVHGARLRTPSFRRSGPNRGEACRTGRRAASGPARRHRPATRLCRQGPEQRRQAGSRRRATPATPAAYRLRDHQTRNP